MFSRKAIATAVEIQEGAVWADAMRGFTVAEVREVASVIEADGDDDTAFMLRDYADVR